MKYIITMDTERHTEYLMNDDDTVGDVYDEFDEDTCCFLVRALDGETDEPVGGDFATYEEAKAYKAELEK